jgi:hypothetical protein
MGISDQFKDKAQQLQQRAKEAKGKKDGQGESGSKQKRDDMVDRGKDAARKAQERMKNRDRDPGE